MARNALIEFRRDTAANWTAVNPTLASGEPGFETDTGKLKLGDGATAWTTLTYLSGQAVTDGTTTVNNASTLKFVTGQVVASGGAGIANVTLIVYAPLTNPAVPDLIFDLSGDVIMVQD